MPLDASLDGSASTAKRRSPFDTLRRARRTSIIAGLLVAGLVAIIIVLYITNGAKRSGQTSSGSLSDTDLQKLSSKNISGGGSNQDLTFHSPTTFDNTLKVSGATTLKDLSISGIFSPSSIDVGKNFQVGGVTLLQGDVTTKGALLVGNNLTVTGLSSFGGNATFNSGAAFAGSLSADSLTVKTASIGGLSFGHIVTTGANPSGAMAVAAGGGSFVISGNDTSGTITFTVGGSPIGGEMVKLNFRTPYTSTPHVNLTPVNTSSAGSQYYVTRSVTAFTINIINPTPGAQYVFDYLVTQ